MEKNRPRLYEAPRPLVAVFYTFVVVWTCFAVLFLTARAFRSELSDILQMIMIAGVLFFTWYFSLNIFYRIRIDADDSIKLAGARRSLTIRSREIDTVEGPYLPIGFVRFKLEREKLYLLCLVRDPDLQAILKNIAEMNPNIRFKTR